MSLFKRTTLFLVTDMGMRRRDLPALSMLLFLFLASACIPFALRLSPSVFENMATSLFEECDPQIAENAIPSNLKLLEGLLKNDPANREILSTLCMGYAGYALLFVEPGDSERASRIYLRALDYGCEALGPAGKKIRNPKADRALTQEGLSRLGKKEFKALFWAALSWNAWINLNLDQPEALAQLAAAQACLEKVMELNGRYFYGLPHILAGVGLSARPPLLGGNPEKARAHFQEALKWGERKFFLAQYYFARYYAVRVQDKELFFKLLREILDGNPQELKEACLINTIIQRAAAKLIQETDELFL
jgi:tetratricopeptide (TPR) repeat protein